MNGFDKFWRISKWRIKSRESWHKVACTEVLRGYFPCSNRMLERCCGSREILPRSLHSLAGPPCISLTSVNSHWGLIHYSTNLTVDLLENSFEPTLQHQTFLGGQRLHCTWAPSLLSLVSLTIAWRLLRVDWRVDLPRETIHRPFFPRRRLLQKALCILLPVACRWLDNAILPRGLPGYINSSKCPCRLNRRRTCLPFKLSATRRLLFTDLS
jgi:hypothetical protein